MKAQATVATLGLCHLRKGVDACVIGLDDSECCQRLREMGLTVGTRCRIRQVAPLGDPVEIEFRGCRLCVRRAEAAGIQVETIAG